MAVFALWSAARSRSTAFFRSMLERPDLIALHEPLEGLFYIGPLEIGSFRFESPESLLEWLLDGTTASVFTKETLAPPVVELVRSNRRFLTEVRHAFLIRRPEEIAASFFALEGDMRIYDTGVEALHELYVTVRQASNRGNPTATRSPHIARYSDSRHVIAPSTSYYELTDSKSAGLDPGRRVTRPPAREPVSNQHGYEPFTPRGEFGCGSASR